MKPDAPPLASEADVQRIRQAYPADIRERLKEERKRLREVKAEIKRLEALEKAGKKDL